MADIVFQEDLPAWLATKSTVRRMVPGCVYVAPGMAVETDTAFALETVVFTPVSRWSNFPASSSANRVAEF